MSLCSAFKSPFKTIDADVGILVLYRVRIAQNMSKRECFFELKYSGYNDLRVYKWNTRDNYVDTVAQRRMLCLLAFYAVPFTDCGTTCTAKAQ